MGAGRSPQQLGKLMMKYLVSILVLLLLLEGCYYDDKELLDPTPACDTTIVTYSGSINPLINAYCTGCHAGPNAPLSINLTTYAGVKAQADNKKLMGTISHSAGFSPMPKNGAQLSSCNIARIRKWIAAGAPNN